MARLQDQPLVRRNPITKGYTPWVAPDHPSYKWWVAATVPWTHLWAPIRQFLAEAGEVGTMLGLKSLGLVQRQLILESTVTAYQDCFLLMTALCIVVMSLVFFIRRAPGRVL
jgi:hypothetical protein